MQKLLTFFSAKKLAYNAIFSDQNFNDKLTNDIISFEQLDPGQNYFCLPSEKGSTLIGMGSKHFHFRVDCFLKALDV